LVPFSSGWEGSLQIRGWVVPQGGLPQKVDLPSKWWKSRLLPVILKNCKKAKSKTGSIQQNSLQTIDIFSQSLNVTLDNIGNDFLLLIRSLSELSAH
jgi:hypothetical protein